jgi:hypothetical protein
MTKTKEYKTINPSLTSFTGAGMSRADLPSLPPPPPSRYNNNNNNRRRGNGRYQNNNAYNAHNAHNNSRTTVAVAATPPPLFAAPAAVVRKIPVVVHKKKDEVLAFEYNTNTSAAVASPPPAPPPVYDPDACDAYLADGVVTDAVCSEHVVRRLCEKTPVEEIEWSSALAETIRRCPGRPQGIIEAVVDHMEGRGFPDIVTLVFDTLIRYEIVEGDAFVDWRESETRRRVVIQTSDWIMKLVEKMNEDEDDDDYDDYL